MKSLNLNNDGIKKDCEYWELESKNDCYMFKFPNCSKCKKYKPKNINRK